MIGLCGLDHIGIRVVDFKRAESFYRQFGFEVTREDLQERVVVLRHPGGVMLNLLDSAEQRDSKRNVLMDVTVKYPGYTHMALGVADISQAMQFVKTLGIAITEGPVTFGNGKTSIFIRDPDRNVIEFTQAASHDDARPDVSRGANGGVSE